MPEIASASLKGIISPTLSAMLVPQHPLPWLCQVTSEWNYSDLPFRALHGLSKRFSPKRKLFGTETFSNSDIHSFTNDLKCAGKPKNMYRLIFEGCLEAPWEVSVATEGLQRGTPGMHPRTPRGIERHQVACWYTRHNQSSKLQIACKTALCSEGKRLCCAAPLWPPTKGHAGQCFTSDWL